MVIQQQGVDITQPVDIIREVAHPEGLLASLRDPQHLEEHLRKIVDKLFVEIIEPSAAQVGEDTATDPSWALVLDKDAAAMSTLLAGERQKRFEEMLRHEEGRTDDADIKMELKDVSRLKVSLATLAECAKAS